MCIPVRGFSGQDFLQESPTPLPTSPVWGTLSQLLSECLLKSVSKSLSTSLSRPLSSCVSTSLSRFLSNCVSRCLSRLLARSLSQLLARPLARLLPESLCQFLSHCISTSLSKRLRSCLAAIRAPSRPPSRIAAAALGSTAGWARLQFTINGSWSFPNFDGTQDMGNVPLSPE
jgi:hypothetical protein